MSEFGAYQAFAIRPCPIALDPHCYLVPEFCVRAFIVNVQPVFTARNLLGFVWRLLIAFNQLGQRRASELMPERQAGRLNRNLEFGLIKRKEFHRFWRAALRVGLSDQVFDFSIAVASVICLLAAP